MPTCGRQTYPPCKEERANERLRQQLSAFEMHQGFRKGLCTQKTPNTRAATRCPTRPQTTQNPQNFSLPLCSPGRSPGMPGTPVGLPQRFAATMPDAAAATADETLFEASCRLGRPGEAGLTELVARAARSHLMISLLLSFLPRSWAAASKQDGKAEGFKGLWRSCLPPPHTHHPQLLLSACAERLAPAVPQHRSGPSCHRCCPVPAHTQPGSAAAPGRSVGSRQCGQSHPPPAPLPPPELTANNFSSMPCRSQRRQQARSSRCRRPAARLDAAACRPADSWQEGSAGQARGADTFGWPTLGNLGANPC
jgi:hypothetical protein